MWNCSHCSERLEDSFDTCWRCGYSREGTPPDTGEKHQIKANRKEARADTKSRTQQQEVVVVDVSVPFGSMVVFMVKWAIASIPAFLILLVLGMLFGGLLGGIGAALFR